MMPKADSKLKAGCRSVPPPLASILPCARESSSSLTTGRTKGKTTFVLVAIALLFSTSNAIGQDRTELEREVEALVSQLASPVFAEREQATESLLQIGGAALPHLRSEAHVDFELRFRAQQIAKRIEDNLFDALSRSFLVDRNPANSYGLPGWEAFSQLAGSSRTSKLLFLDMVKQQPELAALMGKLSGDPQSPRPTTRRDLELLSNRVGAEAHRLAQARLRQRVPEIGDVVAVLFAASFIDEQTPIEVNDLLDMSVHTIPVSTYLRKRGYGQILRAMYSEWLPKSHAGMASRAMNIAMQEGLESGAEVSRKYLDKNFDVLTREQAIQCITRFGDKSDVPLLIHLFDDTALCDKFNKIDVPAYLRQGIDISNEAPPGVPPKPSFKDEVEDETWIVRINDLALAGAMVLSGDDPAVIFPDFSKDERFGFDNRSVAVLDSEDALAERRHLLEVWKQRNAASAK